MVGLWYMYIKRKEREQTWQYIACFCFFFFFFRFCAFLFIFLLYKDQCMRYRVYIQNDGFIRPVMILCVWVFCTHVLWKKNVACSSFPGNIFFYTFWILVDKMLIGTMRTRNDMSFWQIGPGKKENMIFIFDPHLGPLPNIRISRMGAGHNQEQPNPLTTLQCHEGLGSLFPRCVAVFLAQNWCFFHVIIGFKHDVACIVRSEALRGHSDTSLTILVAPSCLRSHNARYIMLKSLIKIHVEHN